MRLQKRNLYNFLIAMLLGLGFVITISNANAKMAGPFSTPDYFANPNYAYSPLPEVCTGVDTRPHGGHCLTSSSPGTFAGGIHKFVDSIATLQVGCNNPNNLGQCLSIPEPDKVSFAARTITDKNGTLLNLPNTDYYSLEIGEYNKVLHSDLALDSAGNPSPTRLHGYRQIATGSQSGIYSDYQYFSPFIIAAKGRPTRVKFRNNKQYEIPLPVDQNYWGAGSVNYNGTSTTPKTAALASTKRSNIHLHGGDTPWISDGTPHQWTVPANDSSGGTGVGYQKGVSFQNAPDMITNGYLLPSGCGASTNKQGECFTQTMSDGLGTLYYPNGQTSRLEWYHDHSFGITRLNVYMGEAGGYLLADKVQEDALAGMGLPGWVSVDTDGVNLGNSDIAHLKPLVIQDRTFVPDNGEDGGQLAQQDPTWPAPLNASFSTDYAGSKKYWLTSGGSYTNGWGFGSLWMPHVYMTNQLPFAISVDTTGNPIPPMTINDPGRWDYAPWMNLAFMANNPPVPCTTSAYNINFECPPIPNPSAVPESFMDSVLVNGTLYPHIDVTPSAYRFKMLNGSDDRMYNLGLYVAATQDIQVNIVDVNDTFNGFGAMVEAQVSDTGALTNLRILEPGMGYKPSETINLTNGSGTGATAYLITDSDGLVKKAIPKNGGSAYQVGDVLSNGSNTYRVDAIGPCGASAGCIKSLSVQSAVAIMNPNTVVVKLAYGIEPTDWTALKSNSNIEEASVFAAVDDAGTIIDFYIDNAGKNYIPGGTSCENINSTLVSLCTEVRQVIPQMYSNNTTPQLCKGSQSLLQYTDNLGLVHVQDMSFGRTGMPQGCWPDTWASDGSAHGSLVADPMMAGPPIIQIGNEGGLLPNAVIIPSTATNFNYNRKMSTLLGATFAHGLVLAPAQRADVVVDFHDYKPDESKTTVLIVYNDFPAPSPLYDTRYDMYTGDPDQSGSGGAPSTLPGYGPNTRTALQIRVKGVSDNSKINVASLTNPSTGIPALFATTQDVPIVSEPDYPGAGNASTPTVGTYASWNLPNVDNGVVGGINIVDGGTYAETPTTTIDLPPQGGRQAVAVATLAGGEVTGLNVTAPGSGYTSAPTVRFTGGGGNGASYTVGLAASALNTAALTTPGSGYATGLTTINTIQDGATSYNCTGTGGCGTVDFGIQSIGVVPGSAGLYTATPALTITGGGVGASGAKATATLAARGSIITLTRSTARVCPATGTVANGTYPVSITAAGGATGATATAVLTNGVVTAITLVTGGSNYPTTGLTATLSGVTGAQNCTSTLGLTFGVGRPISVVALSAKGTGYKSAITVATAAPAPQTNATFTSTVTGYISAINSTNIKAAVGVSATSNVMTLPGGTPSATVTVTHLGAPVAPGSVTKNSGGTGYTSTPTVSFSGGGGTGVTAIAHMSPRKINSFTMINGGRGYKTVPNVTIAKKVIADNYNSADGGAIVGAYMLPTAIDFKGIIEGFDPIWGKLNVELADSVPVPGNAPANNILLAAILPFGYVDPQSEMVIDGGVADWRIDHIGVDSHALHFHLFNTQIINYVDMAGQIYMPDANQLGWVETLKTEPFTSAFIAIRTKQVNIPWEVPNSIRPLDPTANLGMVNGPVNCVNNPFALQPILGPTCVPFTQVDPQGNAVNITNALVNMGSEYVYHCHLLSHEENDMMRVISFVVAPKMAPVLSRVGNSKTVLTITDKSFSETSFNIESRTGNNGPWTPFATVATGTNTTTSSGVGGTTTVNAPTLTNVSYRAFAANVVGCNATVPALANAPQPAQPGPVCSDVVTGWPSVTELSPSSNVSP